MASFEELLAAVRVLLAREVSPGQYRGVWTTDERIVDAVVARLASHYPDVERSETP